MLLALLESLLRIQATSYEHHSCFLTLLTLVLALSAIEEVEETCWQVYFWG